jgi:hypothetical protein
MPVLVTGLPSWKKDRDVFSRLVDAIARRPGPILVIALLLALPSTYWSALLFGDLRADLRELLPEHAESVETLKNLERRFGGWSQLSIVIRSPDRAANRRFSDDLVQKLEKVEAIRSVRNKLGPEYDFFGERRFLYVELKDLVEVEERIEDAIQDAKLAANPLYVDLEEGAKKPQKLDFSDIQKKYEARLELAQRFPDRYFESQDGGQLAVIVRQRGLAFGIERNRALVHTVEALAKELGPASYHPALEVGLGGDVKNLIEESDSLLEDLVTATAIVFVLLGAVVLIYYRRFRAVAFLAVPVFVGSVLTFGLSHFLIGYVNASSAFLGPIVPGNGINFGIILLARYIEERKAGLEVQAALHQAVGFTVRGTSVAAFGAAVAYGSLMATDFLGFRHFGVIGGLGMVFCWISTFTVLPALISWSEARWPLDPNKERFSLYRSGQLAALPARFATWARVPLSILGIVSFVVGSVAAQRLFADPFEKDFGKLRNLATHERGAAYWESQVDLIFGRYLAPQVIVVEQESDIPRVIEHLERSIKDGGERAPIVEVSALQGFVPPDQPQKIEVLNRIRELLSDDLLAQLDEADRKLALEQRPPRLTGPLHRQGPARVHSGRLPGAGRHRRPGGLGPAEPEAQPLPRRRGEAGGGGAPRDPAARRPHRQELRGLRDLLGHGRGRRPRWAQGHRLFAARRGLGDHPRLPQPTPHLVRVGGPVFGRGRDVRGHGGDGVEDQLPQLHRPADHLRHRRRLRGERVQPLPDRADAGGHLGPGGPAGGRLVRRRGDPLLLDHRHRLRLTFGGPQRRPDLLR